MIGKLALAGAAVFALSGSVSAGELNPVFGKAKAVAISQTDAKNVVGKGSLSQYYAYVGNFYSSVAIQYGAYGAYADGVGANSTAKNYYAYAYAYADYARSYYYYAYYYN